MGSAQAVNRETASAIPFAEFLHALRRSGFAVGLGHYARLMTILEQLGPACAPHQLRTVMGPLFATTAEQQERFYRLFDQWFPLLSVPLTAEHPAMREDAADVSVPPVRRGPVTRRRSWLWPIAAASVTVVVVAAWLLLRPVAPPSSVPDTALPTPTVVDPQPIAPIQPSPVQTAPVSRALLSGPVRNGLLIVLVVGFGALEVLLYRRRRLVLERQRRERPPLVWPIRLESASTPLEESSEFFLAARRLRERQTGERSHLDIEQTIAATIQSLGLPVLRYALETQPPEYLVLVERVAQRDHQAGLYAHLVERLTAEGVHAAVYCFEGDPRACEPAGGGAPILLSELRRRFPTHRVVIFSTGDGLIDAITGRRKAWVTESLGWPDRAVLTPEPVAQWGAREVALATHFVVLPATIAGLQAAVDHFQLPSRESVSRRSSRRAGAGSHIPALSGPDCVRILRHYVGETGLQWVCACAVYPELQWQLTLHLGLLHEVSGGAIDADLLMRLVRLPWFRTGSIPDEARAILLRVIKPDVDRAARTAVLALLESHPAPAETIASTRYELDLVVQKLALHGRDRSRHRELKRLAQRMPRDKVIRELTVLRLSEHDPASRLAMRLPERFRSVFFRNGMPLLGMTTGARSTVAAALVAGVLLAGREPAALPADQLAVNTSPDSTAAVRDSAPSAPVAARRDSATTPDSAQRGQAGERNPTLATQTVTAPAPSRASADSARPAAPSLDSLRAIFQRAVRAYESFNVEGSRGLLDVLARYLDEFPAAEGTNVLKYRGAAFAILAQTDSAVAIFAAALARDPFIELDPSRFAMAELQALNAARARTLRVGLKAPVALGDSLVSITYVTTQEANVTMEATQQGTSRRELLFAGRSPASVRTVIWDGLLKSEGGRLAEPGGWTVRVSASNAASGPQPVTATAAFNPPARPRSATAAVDEAIATRALCAIWTGRLRAAVMQSSSELSGNWQSYRDNRLAIVRQGATTALSLEASVEFVSDAGSRVQRAIGRGFTAAPVALELPDVDRCASGPPRVPADSTDVAGRIMFLWRDSFGVNMSAEGNLTMIFVKESDHYTLRRVRISTPGR